VIAPVVASERARAQTLLVKASEGLKDYGIEIESDLNRVGNRAIEGDSPVRERGEER
jgi:CRISPR/Cas system-associated protein Cas7 (RAMP superfamily)